MSNSSVIIENLESRIRVLTEQVELYRNKYQREHINTNRWKNRAELAEARIKLAQEQQPIYMWRLEDDGWMECTKEWFDAEISAGYEKRIVYTAPIPAQHSPAMTVSEGWTLVPIEPNTEMLKLGASAEGYIHGEYENTVTIGLTAAANFWLKMLSASPEFRHSQSPIITEQHSKGIEYVKSCVLANSASSVREELLVILDEYIKLQQPKEKIAYEICSLWRHSSDKFCIQFGDRSGLYVSEKILLTNVGATAIASAVNFYGLSHDTSHVAAVMTLRKLGYTYCDGELWKPPLGTMPDKLNQEQADKNLCALKSVTDSQVNAVVRSFWRRIYPYRNDYERELPEKLPTEFFAHMATALSWVEKEPAKKLSWNLITNENWNIPKIGQRVILCINGVVQHDSFVLDQADGEPGLSYYFWDRDDINDKDCPKVEAGDMWMPWPEFESKFVDLRQITSDGAHHE